MRHSHDEYHELVMIPSPFYVPSVLNTTLKDGTPAYASSDLFIQHPTLKDAWKVYGRTDDQIIHSMGEKVSRTG